MWLLLRILRVADYSMDYQYSLIAVGVFAWVMTHVVVNVAAMTNIIPLTGITLPLLSYGGTSMMAIGAALGLVYQLSKYTARHKVSDFEKTGISLGLSANRSKIQNISRGGFTGANNLRTIEYRQLNNRRRR